jgi:16S rRNA (uracil1498-N3)-methyltransferase
LKAGDEVEVFDGAGRGYSGRVGARGKETCIVLLKQLPQADPSPLSITLAPALIKADRFDWILQKATELGVDEIIPLETHFSEIRIPRGKIESRMVRWTRITQEASRQSRRLIVPRVHAPVRFQELVSQQKPLYNCRLLFYEKALNPWNRSYPLPHRVLICTGPEGGWAESEVEEAGQAGFEVNSLGPRILRAETAAIAAIAIIQFTAETQRTLMIDD